DQDRAAAEADRLSRLLERARGITPGHEADRDQPPVVRAEVRYRPVVGPRPPVEQVGVAARELRRGEGAEDELLRDAEQIERAAALLRIERAERIPALGIHQAVFERPRSLGIAAPRCGSGDGALGESTRAAERERAKAIAEPGIRVLDEPIGELHEMAV